jgi:3-methyladenine DNA glycosylase AlkD
VAEAVRALRSDVSAARREYAAWYYPSRMRVWGSTGRASGLALRILRERLRGAEPAAVLRAARALAGLGAQEPTHLAIALLDRRRDALDVLTASDLRALGRGLDNWATVDGFCVCVAGQAWRRGRVGDAWIRRWARSRDRWLRRAALVSTVALNQRSRGAAGDTRRTLAVCRSLLADRDDMVVKGMSWALRELAKRDPAAVRAFLARHGDAVAPRVRREVGNKLRTGLKNPGSRRPARRPRRGAGRGS